MEGRISRIKMESIDEMDVDSEAQGLPAAAASGSVKDESKKYITDVNIRIMKHRKDVCRTNVSCSKFEGVSNLSLADVIAERNIPGPSSNSFKRRDMFDRSFRKSDSEGSSVPLDQIIRRKSGEGRVRMGRCKTDLNRSLDDIIKEEAEKQKGLQAARDDDGHHSRVERDPGEPKINASTSSLAEARKRKFEQEEEDDVENYIPSPVDIVLQLIKEGFVIHQENKRLSDDQAIQHSGHKWQVTYSCGTASVDCQASTIGLAQQGAALEILKIIQMSAPARSLLSGCSIPEACYYDPTVCDQLNQLLAYISIKPAPRYVTTSRKRQNRDYFTTTCWVKMDEFVASSFRLDDCKTMAAKDAYESFSSRYWPRDTYFVGEECLKDPKNLLYEVVETRPINIPTIPAPAPVDDLESVILPPEQNDDILIDDDGRMYVRSLHAKDKVRRLSHSELQGIIDRKFMEIFN